MSKKTRYISPKVSICIPTYNQAEFLSQALESALNQSFKNIEVVISVNYCTDNTEKILKNYNDPRLKIVQPDRFLKMAENWRFCVSQSSGEYFNLLSSDDVLLPEFEVEQATLLDRYPNAAFAHSACKLINEKGQVIGKEKSIYPSFNRNGEQDLKRYIYGPRCVLVSALIRRTAYNQVGGFHSWKIIGDWDLWLRLLQVGDVVYNQHVLAQYRSWINMEGGSTQKLLDQVMETVALYQKHEPIILKKHPKWKYHFVQAKRNQAKALIYGLASVNNSTFRQEIEIAIRKLSNDWHVRLMLFALSLQLGPALLLWKRLRLNIRQHVKTILYPKD